MSDNHHAVEVLPNILSSFTSSSQPAYYWYVCCCGFHIGWPCWMCDHVSNRLPELFWWTTREIVELRRVPIPFLETYIYNRATVRWVRPARSRCNTWKLDRADMNSLWFDVDQARSSTRGPLSPPPTQLQRLEGTIFFLTTMHRNGFCDSSCQSLTSACQILYNGLPCRWWRL